MMKCLAIDDEPLALEQLKMYIAKVPFLQLVAACHDAYEALQALESDAVDVIFADINMPDLNGIDFARSLNASAREAPIFVFTTAHASYAVEGFKVNAIDYLLKPFGFDEFLAAATKARDYHALRAAGGPKAAQAAPDADDFIYVKVGHQYQRISVPMIRYVEGMAEYVRIWVDGEPRAFTALFTMKKMEQVLAAAGTFLRVHKSYIVNMAKAKVVGKSSVQLEGGEGKSLPIGESYRPAVVQFVARKTIGQ